MKKEFMDSLYLDLIQKCLTGVIYEDPPTDHWSGKTFNLRMRNGGLDWPSQAHTMIGVQRMENIRALAETVIRDGIPGDFVETGVWRGGACIYMRAILKAYQITDRLVWCADSFAGLPQPDPERFPHDAGDIHHTFDQLRISLEEVQANFAKYGLLDEQVKFLKGWFKDTLPTAPIGRLAILRLDGDMYESTIEALENLYPKVSPGGFVIVDDYHAVPGCKKAVHDYMSQLDATITIAVKEIDGIGVFWRKS